LRLHCYAVSTHQDELVLEPPPKKNPGSAYGYRKKRKRKFVNAGGGRYLSMQLQRVRNDVLRLRVDGDGHDDVDRTVPEHPAPFFLSPKSDS